MLLEGFRPPKRLTGSEWADEYGIIPSTGTEPGRWKSLKWQKGILDALTDPTIPVVIFPKSARVGATKLFGHVIGYHAHHDPCPISIVFPDDDMAKTWSREELGPMIDETPALKGLFSEPKQRDSRNSILHKEFPHGLITAFGAGSFNNFRLITRRIMLGDDVSGWPAGTAEGDQVNLMIKRTTNYWNRKIGLASSPGEEGTCRITEWWNKSDKGRFFVPCPSCDAMQYLRFQQFRWKNNDPDTVTYECESCAERIPPSYKTRMTEHDKAEWQTTAPQTTRQRYAGFHIWAAYSNAPNAQWPDIVDEFLSTKDNIEQLRVFVNTTCGELFRVDYATRVSAEGLLGRRDESLLEGEVPAEVLTLTIGVDTQDNRLECFCWGWGAGEEAWVIARSIVYGDPAVPEGQPGSPWDEVTSFRRQRWAEHEGPGLVAPICAVDSGGHHSGAVYEYAKNHAREGVIAIKGGNRKEQPMIGRSTSVQYSFNGRSLKGGKVFTVNSNSIKTLLFGRLKNCEPGTPGSFHFPGWIDDEFARQLTVEQRKPIKQKNGPSEMRWVCPPGKRNEATDGMVYAYASLLHELSRYNRKTAWETMARAKIKRMQGQAAARESRPMPRRRPPQTPF